MKNKLEIILGILILIAGVFYFRFWKKPSLSSQQAGEKAINFINQNLVQGASATLLSVSEEGGVYKVHFKIQDKEWDAYVTKDGKTFFPQAIKMDNLPSPEPTKPVEIPKSAKPEVKLFVMSFCPYGNQAEEIIKPVVDLLGKKVEIEPRYIIYENYASGYPQYCLDKENKYCSMHGINELNQDIREICVYRQNKEKFWDFVLGVNKECNLENVETCWKTVAQKIGINGGTIATCEKNNGIKYASEEKDLNQKYQVNGSPTLVINGVHYNGPRTPEDYKKAICSAFENPPQECQTVLSAETSAPASGGCQ
ncbi:MAG: DsbA family protein [Microgenomates group bacterium]